MELLIAIAILGILITLAVPSLSQLIRNSQVTSQANEVIALINLARNEAIRRGLDGIAGSDGNADLAFLRLDSGNSNWEGNVSIAELSSDITLAGCPAAPDQIPDGIELVRCSEESGISLTVASDTSGQNFLSFVSRGYTSDFSGEVICLKHTQCSGNRQHRRIRVFPSGQVMLNDPQNDALSCNSICQ